LPGYALLALLYPGAGEVPERDFDANAHGLDSSSRWSGLTGVERIVFAVVTSPILVATVTLVSSFTPWGITLPPILAGVVGLTLLFVVGATARRLRLDRSERFAPSLGGLFSRSRSGLPAAGSRQRRRVFSLALAGGVVLFVASLAFAALVPPQTQPSTELYVNTGNVTGDTQSMYPSQFSGGESQQLPLVVANHEGSDADYSVVILLQRVEDVGGDPRVTEQNRLLDRSLTVPDSQQRLITPSISPTMTGTDLRLSVLLYRGSPPEVPSASSAYRSLRLPIDVGGGANNTQSSPEAGQMSTSASQPPTGP
ncbi:MAG: DUF1616 domain-containing protein, partial [Haloarculaceae archaeon]